MDKKYCPCCKQMKLLNDFYSRSGKKNHLKRSYCKACELTQQRDPKNLLQRCEGEKRRTHKRINIWLEWFKYQYGEHPLCECCGKTMRWTCTNQRGGDKDAAVFDHRHGGREAIKTVYAWLGDRACHEKNKAIFITCDFGIICKSCNTGMPTLNRNQWLQNVNHYIRRNAEAVMYAGV